MITADIQLFIQCEGDVDLKYPSIQMDGKSCIILSHSTYKSIAPTTPYELHLSIQDLEQMTKLCKENNGHLVISTALS